MASAPTRADAMTGIVEALKQRIALNASGTLPELGEPVLVGDRTRGTLAAPMIWVAPGRAVIDHTTMGIAETWLWMIDIVGVVANDDPFEGYNESLDLSAKAVAEIMRGRHLDLPYVRDIILVDYSPVSGALRIDNRSIHGSSGQIQIRFVVREN